MGWISEESRSLGAWAYEHAFPEMSTANFGENNHEYDSPADFSAKVQREAKDFDGFAFNDKRASFPECEEEQGESKVSKEVTPLDGGEMLPWYELPISDCCSFTKADNKAVCLEIRNFYKDRAKFDRDFRAIPQKRWGVRVELDQDDLSGDRAASVYDGAYKYVALEFLHDGPRMTTGSPFFHKAHREYEAAIFFKAENGQKNENGQQRRRRAIWKTRRTIDKKI